MPTDPTQGSPIKPQPGSADNPADFVGRAAVDALARQRLKQGVNLLLGDPRRMGKTFWMKHFFATTEEDFKSIHIDYEGVRTSEEFLLRTVRALGSAKSLPKRAREALSGIFDNFGTVEGAAFGVSLKIGVKGRSATSILEQVIDTLGSAPDKAGKGWLIGMDEVPLAILNIARDKPEDARALLQTLRYLRQDKPNVAWIVAGSIGFHHVLPSAASTEGELNDLVDLPLGPLDEADAGRLTLRLIAGIDRSAGPDAEAAMARCAGGIAHLIHEIAHLIDDQSGSGPVTGDEIDAAFRSYLDDLDRSRPFAHLEQRIKEYYGKDSRQARAILDALAAKPRPIAELRADCGPGERFDEVLSLLRSDHYVFVNGGEAAWRYEPLRRIWAERRLVGRG
jgi:hypothetical protein